MPILSGIPAILECRDARTQEMAEFFGIPFVFPGDKIHSLYELYTEANYESFNTNFTKRFDNYEKFLQDCGIVTKINSTNSFFCESVDLETMLNNQQPDEQLLHTLLKNKNFWISYSHMLDIKRKLRMTINRCISK